MDLRPVDWRRAVDQGEVQAQLSVDLNAGSDFAFPLRGTLAVTTNLAGVETVLSEQGFSLDDDPSTWEMVETEAVAVPVGVRSVTVSILFDPNTNASTQGYLDNVRLSLTGIEEIIEDRFTITRDESAANSYRYAFFGSPLTKPALECGVVAIVSGSEFTVENREIDLNETGPVSDFGRPYSVHFLTGQGAGYLLDVVDVPTNDTIVLDTELAQLGIRPGDAYVLREKYTLRDLVGSKNEIGMRPNVPSDPTLIWMLTRHRSREFFHRFFFKVRGLGPDFQWQILNVDFILDQARVHCTYPLKFIVQSIGEENAEIPIYGVLMDAPVLARVAPGFSLLSRIAPDEAEMTLGNSGLADSMQASSTSDTADLLWLAQEDGTFDRYYLKRGGIGGDGWRGLKSPVQDASDVPLTRAFFYQRRGEPTTVRLLVEPLKSE
ncbi:MAG: hypothetical protein R3F19_07205 [Verrucomicrobiales bacterium]